MQTMEKLNYDERIANNCLTTLLSGPRIQELKWGKGFHRQRSRRFDKNTTKALGRFISRRHDTKCNDLNLNLTPSLQSGSNKKHAEGLKIKQILFRIAGCYPGNVK